MYKHQTGLMCVALVALGVVGPSVMRSPMSQASAGSYSVTEGSPAATESDSVDLVGQIVRVDTDRDRVVFATDDGRRFTLDTSRSRIALPGMSRNGETADLQNGMRLHVNGTRISDNIIQADRVRVLSEAAAPSSPTSAEDGTDTIDLRGTVESVNPRQGEFVVHVNDHTRQVFVDDSTDLTGLGRDATDRLPLRSGDRVTVSGVLRPDGTVVADTVSRGHPADAGLRSLEGRVTQESSRYYTRDIKIRVSPDREVKIEVPAGIPITRNGRPISVHDLTKDDVVRVSGIPDGSSFLADHIEAVQSDAAEN